MTCQSASTASNCPPPPILHQLTSTDNSAYGSNKYGAAPLYSHDAVSDPSDDDDDEEDGEVDHDAEVEGESIMAHNNP